MEDGDKTPELQAAEQQIQAMGAEMENMHKMLQNVQNSMEARDLDIKSFEAEVKAYSAETQRISAVQAGMTEEQIQDIAMGVVAAAMESQGMLGAMHREMPNEAQEAPEMIQEPGEMQ
jgi:hypothetical protein